jgi:hypothetical protein
MLRAFLLLLALLPVAACNRAEAPQDVGACWRMDAATGRAPRFTLLAKGVGDLDTCAVLLESLRLQGQQSTNGAYQGSFIFVDAVGMSSARHTDGFRYPIFQPPQRLAVDRDLKRMMQSRGGRMPDVSDLTVERQ